MRILIGFECSGTVRRAMRAIGHDAWSCDLQAADDNDPHHIHGDIREALTQRWDMGIFHPPCTYLTNSANGSLYKTIPSADPDVLVGPARWAALIEAAVLFRELLNDTRIPRVAVENPIMNGHALAIIGRRADQFVQPWMFGHPEKKATGLWLRGLPPLVATDDVRDIMRTLPKSQTDRTFYMSPGPKRAKARAVTFPGIAAAMADQWGHLDEPTTGAA